MLSNKEFEKVCGLAKIAIYENDKESFLKKINQVFEWIDQLAKIDVASIDLDCDPDIKTTPERHDVVIETNTRSEVMSNTNQKKFDMFCVPKVVG